MTSKSLFFFAILASTVGANAALTEQEASQLGVEGTPLTPMGAIRAANSADTVPAWTGGLKDIPAGYTTDKPYIDPFPEDKALFTITAQNVEQYKANLAPGQIAMFKRYPDTYKMHVYPSRRTANYPDWVYDVTLKTARTATLCGERCLDPGTIADGGGIPFPIPKNGLEVVFNSNYSYQPPWRSTGNAIVTTASGDFAINQLTFDWIKLYWAKSADKPAGSYFEKSGGAAWCAYGTYEAPPRIAGQLVVGCAFNKILAFDSYLYIPGQRRVRKAPEVGFYDQPAQGSDGLLPSQARDGMYMSGTEEWYNHTLVGQQELFIPYNNYALMDPALTAGELIKPGHINPEPIRYELHRVWVVESRIKDAYRSTIPHQLTYYDEDSWQSPLATRYDQDDNIWQVQEKPLTYYYDAQCVFGVGTVSYDLISGRYGSLAESFPGLRKSKFVWLDTKKIDYNTFTPQGLRSAGRR